MSERLDKSEPAAPSLRLRLAFAWRRHLGWPALLALALLVAAALVHGQWRPRLAQEQLELTARLAARSARALEARPPAAADASPLQGLPTTAERARDLEAIVDAAQRSGLGLDRADYALTAPNASGVVRVEATLPITGSYAGLRRFVAEVLERLPHAALQSLQIERPTTQSVDLNVSARLTLFYREPDR